MMSSHKFLLKCPICYKKMWLSGALSHKNAKHPHVSDSDFEKKIIAGIKSGHIKVKRFDEEESDATSSTQRINEQRRYSKLGVRSLVPGGRCK